VLLALHTKAVKHVGVGVSVTSPLVLVKDIAALKNVYMQWAPTHMRRLGQRLQKQVFDAKYKAELLDLKDTFRYDHKQGKKATTAHVKAKKEVCESCVCACAFYTTRVGWC
jgi:hypothetical protein